MYPFLAGKSTNLLPSPDLVLQLSTCGLFSETEMEICSKPESIDIVEILEIGMDGS